MCKPPSQSMASVASTPTCLWCGRIRIEDAAAGGHGATEQRSDAVCEQRVVRRADGHCEHLAVVELALIESRAFEGQVFFPR